MILLLAQIVVKALGLVYRLVITNIEGFGDVGNGLYGAGYQIYTLLLAVSSIGVPNAIAKMVSERLAVGKRKEAHEVFRVAFFLFAMIGMGASLLLFFFSGTIANWMGNPQVRGVMMALSPAIFFVAIASVIRGYFNGMYNMKATSHSQMLEQLLKSILTIILVQSVAHLSLNRFSWLAEVLGVTEENRTTAMAIAGNVASSAATVISCCYLWYFYLQHRKHIWYEMRMSHEKKLPHSRYQLMQQIIAIAVPISLASIISAIHRNIDTFTVVNGLKVALRNWSTHADVITQEATRLYGILSGKIDILIGMPSAFNVALATALVPAISSAMATGNMATAKRRVMFSLRLTVLIAFPCAVGIGVLAGPILQLFFPHANAPEATTLLQISSLTIIFSLMNQTLGGILQGSGKVYIPVISLAVGAVVKLCFNLLLIPHREWGIMGGINGAAVSSVIASRVAMEINLSVVKRQWKLKMNKIQTMIKPFIATMLMGTTAYFSYSLGVGSMEEKLATIVAILSAVVIYLLGIVVFRILNRDDYRMLPYGKKLENFFQKQNRKIPKNKAIQ